MKQEIFPRVPDFALTLVGHFVVHLFGTASSSLNSSSSALGFAILGNLTLSENLDPLYSEKGKKMNLGTPKS